MPTPESGEERCPNAHIYRDGEKVPCGPVCGDPFHRHKGPCENYADQRESGEGEGIKRIVLEPRGNQWVVKVDGFYGGYVSDAQARALIGFGIPAP